jgi:hypothetical protein
MAGLACRVSSATPVLGPAFGMLGVGFASAAAGQASLQCKQYYRSDLLDFTCPVSESMSRVNILLPSDKLYYRSMLL